MTRETPNQYIDYLIDGGAVGIVPEEMRMDVFSLLQEKISIAINNGDVLLTANLQNIKNNMIALIKDEENQKKEQGKESDINIEEIEESSRLPKDEIDKIIDNLLKGKKLPHSKLVYLPNVISHCKERKQNLVKEEKLREAQAHENIIQELLKIQNLTNKASKRVDKSSNVKRQLDRVQVALLNKEAEYEVELSKVQIDRGHQKEELVKSFEEKLREFDEESKNEIPSQYFKFSQKLLNLREIEYNLVSSKRYREAAEIKASADSLEKEEREEIINNFNLKRKQLRVKMVQEQEKQLECFEQNTETKIVAITRNYEESIAYLKLTLENVERKLDEMNGHIKSDPIAKALRTSLNKQQENQQEDPGGAFITQLRSQYIDIETQTMLRYRFH